MNKMIAQRIASICLNIDYSEEWMAETIIKYVLYN